MAEFHFTVHHIPGRSNTADGLSRQDIPVAQLNSLELALEIESEDARLISEGYSNDPELSHILRDLLTQDPQVILFKNGTCGMRRTKNCT